MFNSSLRQAARSCPNATFVTRNIPNPTSRQTAAFCTRGHQRRHSSSKPPIPPSDGSSSISAPSVKQVGAPRSNEKRPGTESRLSKRKGAKGEKTEQAQDLKDNEWTQSLPSVPSTQHLHPTDVYVAAFYSTHRPISITGALPETQIEDIDKVFQVKPKKVRARNGPAEVIYTLHNTIQSLDEQSQNTQQQDPNVQQKADLIKTLTQHNQQSQHLDGHPTRGGNVKIMIEEIAKRFRPFNAPPAPRPVPDINFKIIDTPSAEAQSEAETNEEMQAKQLEKEIENQDSENLAAPSKSDVLTLKSGSFFTQHRSPITDPNQQARKGGRTRRGVYVDPKQTRLKYYLISVKRQRKAKMKKHKMKKFLKKTKNLRRRLDSS